MVTISNIFQNMQGQINNVEADYQILIGDFNLNLDPTLDRTKFSNDYVINLSVSADLLHYGQRQKSVHPRHPRGPQSLGKHQES